MPELVEQMYCAQQIVIPPKFPYILKRYCKAAIKTQPYDLLRWSYEYFKALSLHKPPPIKLRLEYPVYSTEGGLTRGCLKVLANQLSSMIDIPLPVVKAAWRGFCLDTQELTNIFCLCEVYMRQETVPFLHFIAVAGGLLTKSLTHTMILLCESLTKEPDGGSACIPFDDFLKMYKFLALIDASRDVKYCNGYREGEEPTSSEVTEVESEVEIEEKEEDNSSADFWMDAPLQKIALIGSHVAKNNRLSRGITMPSIKVERTPSVERSAMIDRDNYMRERRGRAAPSDAINSKLHEMSLMRMSTAQLTSEGQAQKQPQQQEKAAPEAKQDSIEISVYDEDDNEIPYEFYGEPKVHEEREIGGEEQLGEYEEKDDVNEEQCKAEAEAERIAVQIAELFNAREERLLDLEQTFEDIVGLVHRFKSANYDLGMVAGRQMSTTSGEFIVQHIQNEIMEYIDEQIAILPDPDLKKKKAKPEEVQMIREMLETFLDENMETIVPEIEEAEEEEEPIPDIIIVHAVPGIGSTVDQETYMHFTDYATEVSKIQGDLFMPRNIRHFLCPPLERYDENYAVKEEIPKVGVITD